MKTQALVTITTDQMTDQELYNLIERLLQDPQVQTHRVEDVYQWPGPNWPYPHPDDCGPMEATLR